MTVLGGQRWATRFGRYRPVSVLAEGGMGVVYRAEDSDTGRVVALKTVLAARRIDLECLRREIRALSRIEHPAIVRILAQGIDGGRPWYAMEFVEGESMRALLDGEHVNAATRTAGPHTAPVRQPLRGARLAHYLHILQRVCAPLSFLHGEGFVHRDLKPENVVVRPSGDPVIVDFGLAAQFGGPIARDAVSAGLHADLGTIGYMAPEQRAGELLDARVDIYALGCMLYEALTGELPGFSLRPPSEVVEGIDPRLGELAMRMLASDRRDRVGYVDDVAAALGGILDSEISRGPAARMYLYRPSFVGRDDAVARLADWIARAPGGLALIRGESGAGKTRLMMEVARRAPGLRVLAGDCRPIEGSADVALHDAPLHPLTPVLHAIADHCRIHGPAAVARILGRRGRVLAAYEPTLGELPGIETQPEPVALPPQSARARLYADLAETLTVFAAEVPSVILLDDLQWSDELTSTFLIDHCHQLAHGGVRVIGTYRSETASPTIGQLERVANLSIEIDRLSNGAITEMIADMLAIAAPPEPLVQFMSEHSEGNPFFIAEYLRSVVEEGWLTRDRLSRWQVVEVRGTATALPLPDSLRSLVTRRLGDVTHDAASFIAAAAVLGRDVEPSLVGRVLALGEAEELDLTAELLRKHVLEQLADNRLRFAHDKLREVAYGTLADTQRRDLHRRAAEALVQLRAHDASSSGMIAHHFLEAGIDDRALDYLEKAGDHALQSAAHGQARQLFERALSLSERRDDVDPFRRTRWMRRMAEAAFGQGDIMRSETHAVETMARLAGALPASKLGWTGLIVGQIARQGLHWLRPGQPARDEIERARSLEAARTAGQLASTYYFTGDALRMVGLLLAGVNFADRAGSPSTVVESYARLGYIAGVTRLHRVASHYFARAGTLSRSDDRASGRALTLYLHAFYHLGVAQWAEAEAKGDAAVALLVESGDRQDAEIAQTIASHAVYFAGRFREARERYSQVLASARGRGNVQHEAWGLYLLGRSDLALGDVERATDELEHGWRLVDDVADRFSTVMCGGLLAQAYLARRDLAAAVRIANELDRSLAGPVIPLAPCVHGYVGAAEALLAAAESDRAPRARDAARSAARRLARFARAFPMARPAALRIGARLASLEQRPQLALRRLHASARGAREYGMPYEEALAHADLAAVDPGDPRAAYHRATARELFSRLSAQRALAEL